MNCPKCNSPMHKVSVDEYEVDCCGQCDGIWFDLREHDHLKDIRGSEDRIDKGDPEKGTKMNDLRDIDCPHCHTQLIKLAMPHQPHIKYEQCATCGGAFFDAGEFTDWKHLSVSERVKQIVMPFK